MRKGWVNVMHSGEALSVGGGGAKENLKWCPVPGVGYRGSQAAEKTIDFAQLNANLRAKGSTKRDITNGGDGGRRFTGREGDI